jgi:RNA polymerase sigma-70 factor (ECF subfamily)
MAAASAAIRRPLAGWTAPARWVRVAAAAQMPEVEPDIRSAVPPRDEADERRLIDGLRRGDEAVYAELVDRHGPSLLRVASMYVRDRAAAEEVVQETWLGVLRGIDRFQARSSLKTWIFRILVNRAKTRGAREARSVPFSALGDEEGDDGPAVDPDRFFSPDHSRYPQAWAAPPASWEGLPAERLVGRETLTHVQRAIDELPPNQRAVITLRDVHGFTSTEVQAALDVTDVNQRVLLHRARSKVRSALESYLGGD